MAADTPTPGAPLKFDLGALGSAMPELRRDPYPIYRMLRAIAPVLPTPNGVWLVTRHAEGGAILVDKRFLTVDIARMGGAAQLSDSEAIRAAREVMGLTMLFMDPPAHGRIRGLVSKAFSPRMVEALRPRIAAIADQLLSQFTPGRDIDLIKEFAYPLPVIVIAEMLGVPARDRDMFRRWANNLAPLIDFAQDMAIIDLAMKSMEEARDYLTALVEARRKQPAGDLVSALIAAEESGDRLTPAEMLANIVLLLVAGHETTANLIGNGMRALLENPAELEKLRRDPALIDSAVEECLRYDSPVQATGRRATEPVEVAGATIPKDAHAIVIIGACNRDPDRFSDPDRFDISRRDNDHLAFGGGIHYCLGANLARAEARIAIAALAARFPNLALAGGKLEVRGMFNLRGVKALPVRI
ncbi:MAG: cytochrome P450 [Candidatus Binataceae bacterium]